MKSRGIFTEARWYWIGVGALIGYVFLFNLLCIAALTYLNRELSFFPLFTLISEEKYISGVFDLMQHLENHKLFYQRRH